MNLHGAFGSYWWRNTYTLKISGRVFLQVWELKQDQGMCVMLHNEHKKKVTLISLCSFLTMSFNVSYISALCKA